MLDGMKAATQGMMAMSVKQDIIANNLANASTVGFRKEGLVISSFTEILDREVSSDGMHKAGGETVLQRDPQVKNKLNHSSQTYLSQGALRETGNNFDLALDDNGKGFFTIQTDRGIEFTRAGNFRLSTDGFLVNAEGHKLLGHRGPIRANGNDFKVTDNGTVKVDGREVDRILVSQVEDSEDLQRAGGTAFGVSSPRVRASTDFKIKQGFKEMSNVNALQEMVGLMEVMRNFEANQKALSAHDQRLQKAVSELGRVR
jgi:flagellar basal-body rod protein FlgF